MPWQVDGSFLRINTDYSGDNVWQQDQQAAIKVVASRHDIHDEDLADGIEDCLNLDGYNAMRADLSMGGYELLNAGRVIVGTGSPPAGASDSVMYSTALQPKVTVNDETASPAEAVVIWEMWQENVALGYFGLNSSAYQVSVADGYDIEFYTKSTPSLRFKIWEDGGVTIGSPTGSNKGAGTLNIDTDVYVDNVSITTAVNANAANISTNASNISTNTSNISTNTTNISTLQGQVVSASPTVEGLIELATQAEVDAGTDTVRAVTPDTLANASAITTNTSNIATNASDISTLQGQVVSASPTVEGLIELATQAEVDAGTDTVRAVTPDTLASFSGLNTPVVGTFQPSVTCSISDGYFVSGSTYMAYIVIGRLVMINGHIEVTAEDGTPSGTIYVSLPYAATNMTEEANKAYQPITIFNTDVTDLNFPHAVVSESVARCALFYTKDNGNLDTLEASDVDTAFGISLSLVYIKDA